MGGKSNKRLVFGVMGHNELNLRAWALSQHLEVRTLDQDFAIGALLAVCDDPLSLLLVPDPAVIQKGERYCFPCLQHPHLKKHARPQNTRGCAKHACPHRHISSSESSAQPRWHFHRRDSVDVSA